jgi:pilus assembly protein CpaB
MKPARILVLVVAILAGGMAAWLVSGSDPVPVEPTPVPVVQLATVDVLVAGTDINLGSLITVPDLKWQMWPEAAASPQFIRKTDRPDAIEQLAGSITRQAFATGEPIREARLIRAQGSGYLAAILPQGMRAIAMEVSAESGVGGFILPNDRVDIILSRRERRESATGSSQSGSSAVEVHSSTTVLSNLRVMAIDQTIEEKSGQRVVVGRTATIEVTPQQAETLLRAKLMGQLALALRSVTDFEAKDGAGDDQQDTRRSIEMVRYGINTIATVK